MICPACKTDNIEGADECANCGQSLYGLDLPDAPGAERPPEFVMAPLGTLAKRPVIAVSPQDPVTLAVRKMQDGDTSVVVVLNGDKLAGIITPWDILHKVAGPSKDLLAVTCGQVMTPNPIVFQQEDSLALVIHQMSSGAFRHAPVVDRDGRVINVVDVAEVFNYISPHIV